MKIEEYAASRPSRSPVAMWFAARPAVYREVIAALDEGYSVRMIAGALRKDDEFPFEHGALLQYLHRKGAI